MSRDSFSFYLLNMAEIRHYWPYRCELYLRSNFVDVSSSARLVLYPVKAACAFQLQIRSWRQWNLWRHTVKCSGFVAVRDWMIVAKLWLYLLWWRFLTNSKKNRRVRRVSKSDSHRHHVCLLLMSVSLHATTRLHWEGYLMKFCIWVYFEKTGEKFGFRRNLTRLTDTLNVYLYTLW